MKTSCLRFVDGSFENGTNTVHLFNLVYYSNDLKLKLISEWKLWKHDICDLMELVWRQDQKGLVSIKDTIVTLDIEQQTAILSEIRLKSDPSWKWNERIIVFGVFLLHWDLNNKHHFEKDTL